MAERIVRYSALKRRFIKSVRHDDTEFWRHSLDKTDNVRYAAIVFDTPAATTTHASPMRRRRKASHRIFRVDENRASRRQSVQEIEGDLVHRHK